MMKMGVSSVLLMACTTTAALLGKVTMPAKSDLSVFFEHLDTMSISDFNATEMATHGCWCKNERGRAVDEVDSVCKAWRQARRCLRLEGGACSSGVDFEEYTMDLGANNPCQDANQNSCQTALCKVDWKWMNLLEASKAGDPSYEIIETGPSKNYTCEASTEPQAPKKCEGTAPDVKIVPAVTNLCLKIQVENTEEIEMNFNFTMTNGNTCSMGISVSGTTTPDEVCCDPPITGDMNTVEGKVWPFNLQPTNGNSQVKILDAKLNTNWKLQVTRIEAGIGAPVYESDWWVATTDASAPGFFNQCMGNGIDDDNVCDFEVAEV